MASKIKAHHIRTGANFTAWIKLFGVSRQEAARLSVLAIEHQLKVIIAAALIRFRNREFILGEVKSEAFFFSVSSD